MDTTVPQSVMVTFDLTSIGYYNTIALFNVLNGSVNRGWIGIYRVTPHGFSTREIDSGMRPALTGCCNPVGGGGAACCRYSLGYVTGSMQAPPWPSQPALSVGLANC